MPAKKATAPKNQPTLKRRLHTLNFFVILAILLGMIAGILMVKAFYRGEPRLSTGPVVTLGMLEYEVIDGKAVKRDTPMTNSLRTFLEERAAKDCDADHAFMEPAEYTVVAATKNMTQVLLGYGCGDLSARMFAVYEDDGWKFLSPTNQFDMTTNAPLCSHVEKHDIKKEIAPVCYKVSRGAISYHVR